MSHEEIEVKFLLDDLTAMRQRLLSMGATLATPRTYEDNLCFDNPDQRLQQHGDFHRLVSPIAATPTDTNPATDYRTASRGDQ